MIRITYIISDIDKALTFEWIAKFLNKEKFELSFILLNPGNSHLEQYLLQQGFQVSRVTCCSKKDWPKAIIDTYKQLRQWNTEIVHCHLLQANIIGLAAAKLAGISKRIYSRHHSSFHHVYHPKGIWWDKLSNKMATKIIAISEIVACILKDWENVPVNKIVNIPHGFKLELFRNVTEQQKENFRIKYSLKETYPVIGVISRFTELKGVQFIIPAFKRLLNEFPNSILLLLNAKGDFSHEIHRQLKEISPNNYRLIEFENDIFSAYASMDLFIHVPIDEHSEAFGQIYIEALAAEVPSIFTLSGIAHNFINDGENALIVPFKNSNAILEAMIRILNNEKLRESLRKGGWNSVKERFALDQMIKQLERLYAE